MNCIQFNTIPLEEVLQILGHLPTKQTEKEAWFLNPFAKENHASFKINKNLNYWYLHSEGIGGNNIDFVKKYFNFSLSEILEWARQQYFSSFHQQRKIQPIENLSKNYEIFDVKHEILHPALIQYLLKRKVWEQRIFLKEIHYRMNDKNYFGIGFKNDSGGYEIRNKYSKICLGKKDVSMIKNGSENLKIFEGFFDFLSFKNIEKSLSDEKSDYIILNSVSMISKIKSLLENHKNIGLYFDNDEAGNRAVETLKKEFENVEDDRILYKYFKDLNEWAMSSPKLEEKLGGSLVQKVPKVYNKRGR